MMLKDRAVISPPKAFQSMPGICDVLGPEAARASSIAPS
jgi:hypothetical protein